MVDGHSKVFTLQENGKVLLLCLYDNFGIIGDLELLSNTSYSASIEALSDVYCVGMSIEHAKKMLIVEDNRFLRYIATNLANEHIRNTKNCTFNLLYPLENRLATYILLSSENLTFNENLTQLSEMLATSYRHLLRVLVKFCDLSILEKHDSHYEIINLKELESMANGTIHQFEFQNSSQT